MFGLLLEKVELLRLVFFLVAAVKLQRTRREPRRQRT